MFTNIPSHWELKELGELLKYEQPTQYIVESTDYNNNYKTPVLTAGKSFILGYTNEETGIVTNIPVIIFDDFTTESKYVDFPFKVKSSAMKILNCQNKTTLKYLYYLMQEMPDIKTAHKRYWISEYAKIKVPIPKKLEEQEEIVKILDDAEDMVRLRQECINHTEDLTPAIFYQMFGNMISNEKQYKSSPVKKLGNVVTGATPPSKLDNMFGGEIPFVTPGDLESNTYKYSRYVTDEGAQKSRLVRSGSTMVCCIGATIGKVDKAITESAFNQQINAVEWNNDLINDDFALHLFRQLKPLIKAKSSSTTLPILNKGNFEQLSIPTPPIEEQKEFASIAREIDDYKKQQYKELDNANDLFQSLLQKAFTGELTANKVY